MGTKYLFGQMVTFFYFLHYSRTLVDGHEEYLLGENVPLSAVNFA